ncbi:Uncharacterised protein [Candidatus Norongarragalina meridionalis]|nr:Uncharacterised protein [Candidatus Norongarragalina meridionalis]
MKKVILAMLFLMPFAFAATMTVLSGQLELASLRYSPQPAEPGKYVDFWLGVSTKARDTLTDVECAVVPDYPFSIDATESANKTIGDMPPYSSAVLQFKLRVDANAVKGDNRLTLKCRTGGYDWGAANTTIYVQPQDAVLTIGKVEANPPEVEPGGMTRVTITMKNDAQTSLKDIALKLDLSSVTTPIAPIGSGTERRIGGLVPGESQSVYFEVMAYASAQPQVYKIPLDLAYADELGKTYEKTEYVGIVISATPRMDVILEDTKIIRPDTGGTVSLSVVNIGKSDVKFLTAKLLPSNAYSLLSPNEVYVGAISSDDSSSIEYKIFVAKDAPHTIDLPVQLTYTDASNRQHTETKSATMRVYTEEEITNMDLEQKAGMNIIVVGIGVAVLLYIGYYLYKRFVKKK